MDRSEDLTLDVKVLHDWIANKDFKYYTLNYTPQFKLINFLSSKLPYIGVAWRQIFRVSPLNFRKILGLSSNIIDPQASIILSSAYLELFKDTKEEKYKRAFETCCDRVIGLNSNHTKHFAIRQNKRIFLNSYNASYDDIAPILTVWAGELFLDAYIFFKEERFLKLLRGVKDYFLHDLPREETQDSVYFYYTPKSNFKVWNASCEISSFLIQVGAFLHDENAFLLGRKGIDHIVRQQQPDGSWFYGATGPVTKYVDNFHTGFILKALFKSQQFYSSDELSKSFQIGIRYYKETLFKEVKEGIRPIHYDSRYMPKNSNIIQDVDIRDSAMALILFSELPSDNIENLEFAREVYKWTKLNMKEGKTFVGEKTWLWKNKIPYIDFQAWMLLAMAKLSKAEKELC